jgi:hypothetical protein
LPSDPRNRRGDGPLKDVDSGADEATIVFVLVQGDSRQE